MQALGAPLSIGASSIRQLAFDPSGRHLIANLNDRTLRTLAEMENLRRRTQKEVADARTYGVT